MVRHLWNSRSGVLSQNSVEVFFFFFFFLILTPTSSGALERFSFMTAIMAVAQNQLSNIIWRMRFMAQFNGDIEDRLI